MRLGTSHLDRGRRIPGTTSRYRVRLNPHGRKCSYASGGHGHSSTLNQNGLSGSTGQETWGYLSRLSYKGVLKMPSGRLPKEGSKWYLPPNTYRTVQHFCLSYMEIQKKIIDLSDEIDRIGLVSGQHLDGMPHGTDVTNPTEQQAIRKKELIEKRDNELRKMRIIERAVERTAFTGRRELLMAVTSKHMTYERLRGLHGVPYGKNQFGRLKQQVYWRIAQEL